MPSAHSTTSTNPVPIPCQALTTQAPSTDLFDTRESTDFGNTDTICLSPSDFCLYDQEPEVVNLFTDLNFSNAPTIFTTAVSTVTSAVQRVAATSIVQNAGPCSLDGYDASLPPPPPELWMESFPNHISYLAIPMPPRLKSSVSLSQPEVSVPPPQPKTSFASPQPEVSVSLPQPEVFVPPPQPRHHLFRLSKSYLFLGLNKRLLPLCRSQRYLSLHRSRRYLPAHRSKRLLLLCRSQRHQFLCHS